RGGAAARRTGARPTGGGAHRKPGHTGAGHWPQNHPHTTKGIAPGDATAVTRRREGQAARHLPALALPEVAPPTSGAWRHASTPPRRSGCCTPPASTGPTCRPSTPASPADGGDIAAPPPATPPRHTQTPEGGDVTVG